MRAFRTCFGRPFAVRAAASAVGGATSSGAAPSSSPVVPPEHRARSSEFCECFDRWLGGPDRAGFWLLRPRTSPPAVLPIGAPDVAAHRAAAIQVPGVDDVAAPPPAALPTVRKTAGGSVSGRPKKASSGKQRGAAAGGKGRNLAKKSGKKGSKPVKRRK